MDAEEKGKQYKAKCGKNIEEWVVTEVSDICGGECKPSDTFEELGLDSLDCIQLQTDVSLSLGVYIPDDVWEKAKNNKNTTVGDLINYIKEAK